MHSPLVLTQDMMIVLGLTGFIIAMLMFERIRADAASLVVLVMLGFTGIVSEQELFKGFAGDAVISVIASMILSTSLDRTGALNRLAGWLLRRAKGVEQRLLLLTSAFAGGMSGFMQNPAVTSLFLPVASRLSSRTGLGLGQLLFPIAAAIVLGGQLTMIGNSPLMLLNDLLQSANSNLPSGVATLEKLPMFQPLPIGLLLLGIGLLYFRFRKYLWFSETAGSNVSPATPERYFADAYGIDGEVFELTVTAGSPLVGMSVGDAEAEVGAPLFLALFAGNESRMAPPADERLWVGSVIGVMGSQEFVQAYARTKQLKFSQRLRVLGDLFNPAHSGISEAVIPTNSPFVGRTQAELRLRKRFGISLLAINRDKQILRRNIRNLPIRSGDILVFHSNWTDLSQAGGNRDFVVITDFPKDEQRPHKLRVALGIFACSMLLALSTLVPLPVALMAGAVAMVVTGVLNMDEAYASVSWKTVFTMACLIPLGIAMDSTGAANWLAQQTIERLGDGVPDWLIQTCLAVFTTCLALVIGNVGATVVMVPMAVNIALAADGNPMAYAFLAALCASNNFISHSNPVISMITGPAGYRAGELWRNGLPITVLYLLVSVLSVNLMF
ncbi:MAG: SLC13 family permease [Arenimonas sp.]